MELLLEHEEIYWRPICMYHSLKSTRPFSLKIKVSYRNVADSVEIYMERIIQLQ